jgi:hypothetical protein
MTDTEKLLAIEAIRNLKPAYFRAMDTKDWDELPGLFTEDAMFDARGALEMPKAEEDYAAEDVLRGRTTIAAYIRAGLTPLISIHQGHAPEIEILSATEAKGIWPMTDILIAPPGAPFRVFRGYGHYRETYRFEDGGWRIHTSVLRRLWVEMA